MIADIVCAQVCQSLSDMSISSQGEISKSTRMGWGRLIINIVLFRIYTYVCIYKYRSTNWGSYFRALKYCIEY